MQKIPYTVPKFSQEEADAVNDLLLNPENILAEKYSKACRKSLTDLYQSPTLLTHSCTAALEISALLLNLQPGDEIILPSFTFVSTANAFALFGAKPVFVDITENTLNINPLLLEQAITAKTKAIVVMHYAAIACEMDRILEITNTYNLPLIEDAAQCIGATFHGIALGTFGQLGTLSFHHTKNITAGLGGALIVNDDKFLNRAKILWQKGTDREAFIEGQVDKYTWQDLGSSYVMNEFGAAILHGQFMRLNDTINHRLSLWNQYQEAFVDLEQQFNYRRPFVPEGCRHNAHIYYLVAPSESAAKNLRHYLSSVHINAPSHYVPLHLAPAGRKFGVRKLPVCEDIYKRLIRLPLWEGVETHLPYILEQVYKGAKASG